MAKKLPAVSILMPVVNGERFLDQAIQSCLSQLDERDELVVQDGGSNDGTLEILGKYTGDARISFRSEQDLGQSDALSKALARARGDYIGWLNCDDLLAPKSMARLRGAIASSTDLPVLVYGDFNIIDEGGRVLRELIPGAVTRRALLARGCFLFSGSSFVRADSLRGCGFDRSFHFAMDYNLFVRLSEASDFSALYVTGPLASFRIHGESKTGGSAWKFIGETYRVRKEAHKRMPASRYQIVTATARHVAEILSTRLRYSEIYGSLRGSRHETGQRRGFPHRG